MKIIFIPFLLFISLPSLANTDPGKFEATEAFRHQGERLEKNRQQREALEHNTPLAPEVLFRQPASETLCFDIDDIQLSGANLLPVDTRQRLISPLLHRCLGLSQIQALVQQVSGWYLDHGYITSRTLLPEQDLSRGVLQLQVLEGRLQEINLDQDTPLMLPMAFPSRLGEPLNLRDIEQGMEQINRLRHQPIQIDISPGDHPGQSVVNLRAPDEFPLQFGLSHDNVGQKNTGTGQISGKLVGNNLLGLADRWVMSGGRSSHFANDHDSQHFQTSVNLPYGYWTAEYGYSWSRYLSTYRQPYVWRYNGDSETHRLSLSRVLYRDENVKTGLMSGVNWRNSRNYLNDIQLNSSSRKLAHWFAGINHSQKLWGGYGTLNPALSRGVSWGGAENDKHKSDGAPQAEFSKWQLSASYYLPVGSHWAWLSSFYAQWSSERLYGSERLTLGGEYSVRGYREQYLSGDNGGYWRNEISRSFSMPLRLGEVNVFAALDGGYLRSGPDEPEAKGSLMGSALGISHHQRYVNQQFTLGWPLIRPGWLHPDSVAIYYRLALTF